MRESYQPSTFSKGSETAFNSEDQPEYYHDVDDILCRLQAGEISDPLDIYRHEITPDEAYEHYGNRHYRDKSRWLQLMSAKNQEKLARNRMATDMWNYAITASNDDQFERRIAGITVLYNSVPAFQKQLVSIEQPGHTSNDKEKLLTRTNFYLQCGLNYADQPQARDLQRIQNIVIKPLDLTKGNIPLVISRKLGVGSSSKNKVNVTSWLEFAQHQGYDMTKCSAQSLCISILNDHYSGSGSVKNSKPLNADLIDFAPRNHQQFTDAITTLNSFIRGEKKITNDLTVDESEPMPKAANAEERAMAITQRLLEQVDGPKANKVSALIKRMRQTPTGMNSSNYLKFANLIASASDKKLDVSSSNNLWQAIDRIIAYALDDDGRQRQAADVESMYRQVRAMAVAFAQLIPVINSYDRTDLNAYHAEESSYDDEYPDKSPLDRP